MQKAKNKVETSNTDSKIIHHTLSLSCMRIATAIQSEPRAPKESAMQAMWRLDTV